MKKIKIMRIIARLNIGGPAINTVLLSAGLDKDRFESVLVTGMVDKGEGDMSYLAKESGIQPIIIPQLGRRLNIYNDAIALWKLLCLVAKQNPDIIHTHTAKAGTLGRVSAIIFNLAHKKKIKVVHTFHGHVLSGYFNKISTCFFIFIERVLAGFTDIIIAVSEVVRKDILSLGIGSEEKIKVVHLGFELGKFLDIQLRTGYQLNIGIIGRLVPIKNHKMFLDAIKLISEYRISNIEYRFFVVGDGELRQELERYAEKLGIDNRVEFLGWQRDLVKIYSDMDVIVLTSLNEGTPVSLIEALASARAVVAADVGGVSDILGADVYPKIAERGILVRPQDANAFASAVGLLLSDPALRHKLALSGREFVRDKFNSKRLIKDMEILYNSILKDRRE